MFSPERKSSSFFKHSVSANNKDRRNNTEVVYVEGIIPSVLTAMLTLFLLQRSANLLHSLELVWFWIVGHIREVSCVLLGQDLLLKIAPFNLLSSSFGGNRFCARRRSIVLGCWACCALSAQPHSISCVLTAILG